MEKEIKKLKTRLWKLGYSVRDYSGLDARFDLLVNEKFKVIVKKENPENIPEECDVLAMVKKDKIIFFVRPANGMVGLTCARDAFRKV
jgi:hypothetical protein